MLGLYSIRLKMNFFADMINQESKSKIWLSSLRLRTLPLALGGTLLGSLTPEIKPYFDSSIFVFTLLTASLLQILSNLANDYGDHIQGTDNQDRVGPERAMQTGVISKNQMLKAIYICAFLAFISGIVLLWLAFGLSALPALMAMLVLGLASIWAALKYTMGSKPYGYSGFGDLAVLVFFGVIGVMGTSFLYLKQLEWLILLPALAYGSIAAGVLNINNLRDIDNDRASGKNTLVVRLGADGGRYYHLALMILALMAELAYLHLANHSWWGILAFLPIAIHTVLLLKPKMTAAQYDPFLKSLALGAVVHVLIFLAFIHL